MSDKMQIHIASLLYWFSVVLLPITPAVHQRCTNFSMCMWSKKFWQTGSAEITVKIQCTHILFTLFTYRAYWLIKINRKMEQTFISKLYFSTKITYSHNEPADLNQLKNWKIERNESAKNQIPYSPFAIRLNAFRNIIQFGKSMIQ